MKAASHPRQEARLAALRRTGLLDTPRERDFDDIARLAAAICGTPVAVVNLIDADRQWFKAEVGLGVSETPLETSLCSHVILENDFVEIPDTLADPRMCDNPLCIADGGFRFYAGALLTSGDGLPIGTLCVLDRHPRALSDLQRDALHTLARQVMTQIDLRQVIASEQMLRNEIDHRVKNSLSSVAAFVSLERRQTEEPQARAVLDRVAQQISTVALLHEQLGQQKGERVDLAEYLGRVAALVAKSQPASIPIEHHFDAATVDARDASLLGTIVNELAANAIKHSLSDEEGTIRLQGTALADGRYRLVCHDAGTTQVRAVQPSARIGLGLRIIATSVRQLNGTVVTDSEDGGYRTVIEVAPAAA